MPPLSLTQKLKPVLRRTACLLPLLAAASLFSVVPTVGAQTPTTLIQQGPSGDPPGRVARMNLAEGPVSFAPGDLQGQGNSQGESSWTPAILNRPLTSGDRLWTGQRARSELHIGSTAVRLGEQTSLDFLTLDDDTTRLRLAQGTMKLRVRALFEGQRIEVNTPNLAFVISQPGDYRIDAVPATSTSAGSTRVVVQQGAGAIYGDGGASVNIAAGQQANFTDTRLTPAGYAPELQDSFDAWALQRDRLEDQSVSARYIPREVVGYQQLDSYGDWSQDPTYGAVWLPRAVPANWAPYRAGHWSWVAPWGWTWVDDAPWGFAPFHYGRWAQIGPRWGWVPGQLAPRPVYAPALVAFIGGSSGGTNWNISLGQQAARPGLGWFPLAPGEVFRPGYRASPRYVTQVNHNIVVNNFNTNTDTNNHYYRYQRQNNAVSAMSAADFARSQPVRGNQQGLSPADLGRAQVLSEGRGALPQRVMGIMALPRPGNPAALPPAAVTVRPVVGIPPMPGRRDDPRETGRDSGRNDLRGGQRDTSRDIRPGSAQGTLPQDRGAFDAGQRNRLDQQRQLQDRQQGQQREQERQQREAARQQQDRAAGQRQQTEESLVQRTVREQAQRDANPLGAAPFPQGRPGFERNNQVQPSQPDAPRPNDESIGQRAMREQLQRQAQDQQRGQQAQQAQQRAQQEQQQAREQQVQQQQRQQQDQARQQQAVQLQQQQAQQRAQQEQHRQAREPQRPQAEPTRNLGRERQPQRQPDGVDGGRARLEDFNRKRD